MIEKIQQRSGELQARRLFLWLVAILPLILGYCIGTIVKLLKFIWAAFVEGFEAGVKL